MVGGHERHKPKPTLPLTPEQRGIFDIVVDAHTHLVEGDGPLVTLYAISLAKAAKLAKGKDVAAFERAARVALATAVKLRCTPQSSIDPVTAGRRKADVARGRPPWLPDELAELNDDKQEEPDA
jgi:hypothetical protein